MKWRRYLPPDWNWRVFTFRDFELFCARDGVEVFELSMSPVALYTVYHRVPVILLNSRLSGTEKSYVGFHELGHHWLHSPGQQFHWGFETKMDCEANIVASCSLIPYPVIDLKTDAEIQEEFGYSHKIIRFRREIYETWGI